jgi:uncharacterized RDD family membrane protein YckC
MNSTNPYAPPRATVTDVTSDQEEIELAGRGLRLGAALLDGVIYCVFIYVPMFAGLLLSGGVRKETMSPLVGLLVLIGAAAWITLTILYVVRNGQTIAKKLLAIKVVRADGSKASLGRIFWLRNVVPGLLGITIIFGLIDILFIFSDSKQCLHDKIADTIVVTA